MEESHNLWKDYTNSKQDSVSTFIILSNLEIKDEIIDYDYMNQISIKRSNGPVLDKLM